MGAVARARRALKRAQRVLDARIDRLPPRVQDWTHGVTVGLGLRRAARVRTGPPPLVTIVLPVYDVQRYLKACLDSILTQSHAELQVVAVDDGSPDHSIDILEAYADRDRRVEIVRQPNAGLGAARNVGASRARGQYLMFVDSDDVLRPGAVSAYVDSLRESGSDFAVGGYQRLTPAGAAPAAPWVRAVHRQARRRTTITEFPEIQVNAVAWSKMYRRAFWDENGLRFPTGVLYEDQAVSARAYASAGRFDVLDRVTYQWRVREDWSSITQQNHSVADLAARLAAAFSSLAELEAVGAVHARDVRVAQLLSNDFPLSIKAAQHADREFWAVLRSGLEQLTASADEETWARVPPQHRLSIQLVLQDQRDALVDFVGLQRNHPKSVPSLVADGQVFLQFPVRVALGLDPHSAMLATTAGQTSLVSGVRRLFWNDEGAVEVHGWAYVDNVDLSGVHPDIHLLLVDLDRPGEAPLELPTVQAGDHAVTAASKHQYANYETATFRATLDPALLLSRHDEGRWAVHVRVETCGLERQAPLKGLQLAGSPGHLAGRQFTGGHLSLSADSPDGLVLSLVQPVCTVDRAELDQRLLRVDLRPGAGFEPVRLALKNTMTGLRLRAPVVTDGNRFRVEVELPGVGSADQAASPARELWTARVFGADGRSGTVAVRPDSDLRPSATGLRLRSTQVGNLGLVEDRRTLVVDAVVAEHDRLVVEGRWFGPVGGAVELRLRGSHSGCAAAVDVGADGRFRTVLHLVADPWGTGSRPLRSGDYDLVAAWTDPTAAGPEPGPKPQRVEVRAEYPVLASLPLAVSSVRLRGVVQLAGSNRLRLHVEPPLRDDELGARHQRTLADRLAARRHDPGFERGAVLFRSYYGEVCGCNPLAVHHELRRLDSGHTLYWAVRDHSVPVPEGGIPVVYESAEWYRLLHDAEFYLDNMHQALYHVKPPHQVQVQTFHGYPFKAMGQSHWRYQRRDVAHIRSYLDRAADWDFLVSPASYATELLRDEFGFPNEVLAIGYPRNDILQSPDADAIRDRLRQRLGIRPDQTAVLYAPTFRDHLARGDFRAAMTDFLDLPALGSALGDDFVVLVRGHAFHARMADRVGSRGNVLDVTDHPDINELCLASDCAVLDYSSLRFDYGLTGKPMIFLVPDLEDYARKSRGTLFDYEPSAPGPLVATTAEVAEALLDLDGQRHRFAEPYASFRREYLDLDDGHATERLVSRVFLR